MAIAPKEVIAKDTEMTSQFTDPATDKGTLVQPVIIETPEALSSLLEALEGVTEIGVDTEADSFYSYTEKVCLLQLTIGKTDYLIDPLVDLDLSPLGEIFKDESVVKILHDGEFDVLILGRDFHFRFKNIFDTRIAAAALGFSSPGLAAVLDRYFGIEVDKSEQRSDWSRRPLKQSQIDYARLDTRYLMALKERMAADLEAAGRRMILDGECERLEELEPVKREFDPDGYAKIKGANGLSPAEKGVLKELFCLRNSVAEERDVPPFKVLGNHVLMELAARMPSTMNDIDGLKGFPKGRRRSLGRDTLAAVQRGRQNPITKKVQPQSRTPRLDDEPFELHERLRSWRRERAEQEGMDSSLVLNRHVMLRIAIDSPKTLDEFEQVEGLRSWQLERFGDDLVHVAATFAEDLAAGRVSFDRRKKRHR